MYKPNFCAECGERVLRERWRAWTTRRFCTACEGRFRRAWLAPLLVACALVLAGFAMGRMMRPAPPPLTIERGALPVPALLAKNARARPSDDATTNAMNPAITGDATGESTTATNGATSSGDATRTGLGVAAEELPTDPDEVVSICGARTKKGTPCQRRVRGTGRCWQHRGMPAMLPPEKLIVRN
ncbi:MAG: hypothetical protein QOF61_2398 [Acidobacteriota bacterium]|nr:hypothetical protein [Acidobacteriota bacterium]